MAERGDVLVTGGGGYIGSHACKALAAAGFRPVAFDNLGHGHEEAVRWGPLERGDVLDRARLADVFQAYDFVGAMHFAAFTAVGESVTDPGKYYRNNVGGTLTLLQALAGCQPMPLIFSSTAAVYGTPAKVPISERALVAPINPYGRSKLTSELAIADHSAAHGFTFTSLRYFNACGADPDGEIGECHDPETHLIPLAFRAVSGGPQLTLFGDDYATPDGTCVRDYIHVSDLATAHVVALERLIGGGESLTLNLGTGTGVSVRQVLNTIEQVTGRVVPQVLGERRLGDPAVLVADVSRARDELGWTARMSEIETMVITAWAWHRSRQHA